MTTDAPWQKQFDSLPEDGQVPVLRSLALRKIMKSRRFTSVIQFFLTPEAFLPFLFGSACLGVVVNAVYGLLTNRFGSESPSLAGIAVGAIVIFLLCVWLFKTVLARFEPRPVGAHTRPPEKHQG